MLLSPTCSSIAPRTSYPRFQSQDRFQQLSPDKYFPTLSFPIQAEVNTLSKGRPEVFRVMQIPVEVWLSQFKTQADQQTALLLLKKVQIFDLSKTRSSLQKIHHQLFTLDGLDLSKTRLSYLGAGKSGAVMAYFYRQANQLKGDAYIPETHFLEFNQLGVKHCPFSKKPIENLVIIDDIILSGRQSIEYLEPLREKLKAYKQVDFYCLAGTDSGVERVRQSFPELRVRVVQPIQHIYEKKGQDALFTEGEKVRIKDLIERYSDHFPKNGVLKPKQREGLVVFFYNSPDETLPLLTHQGSGPTGWKPPFPRYWGEKVNWPQ